MIEQFHLHKKAKYDVLLDFIKNNFDYDFYYTVDNERFFVNDLKTLKSLLRSSCHILVQYERDTCAGLVLLWKSKGGGKTRYYLKMLAENQKIAYDLLTALFWKTYKEIHVKIRKDSPYLGVLRSKGFRFCGSRGIQILLCKEARKVIPYGTYIGKCGDDC